MPQDRVVFLPVRPLKGEDAQRGGKLLSFFFPIRHDTFRCEDQARQIGPAAHLFAVKMTEGLNGFPESHIIGEDTAEALLAEELQPLESVLLIGPETGEEFLGGLGRNRRLEALELLRPFSQGFGSLVDNRLLPHVAGQLRRPHGMQPHFPLLIDGVEVEKLREKTQDGLEFLCRNGDKVPRIPKLDRDLSLQIGLFQTREGDARRLAFQVSDETRQEIDLFATTADAVFKTEPIDLLLLMDLAVIVERLENPQSEPRIRRNEAVKLLEFDATVREEVGPEDLLHPSPDRRVGVTLTIFRNDLVPRV